MPVLYLTRERAVLIWSLPPSHKLQLDQLLELLPQIAEAEFEVLANAAPPVALYARYADYLADEQGKQNFYSLAVRDSICWDYLQLAINAQDLANDFLLTEEPDIALRVLLAIADAAPQILLEPGYRDNVELMIATQDETMADLGDLLKTYERPTDNLEAFLGRFDGFEWRLGPDVPDPRRASTFPRSFDFVETVEPDPNSLARVYFWLTLREAQVRTMLGNPDIFWWHFRRDNFRDCLRKAWRNCDAEVCESLLSIYTTLSHGRSLADDADLPARTMA